MNVSPLHTGTHTLYIGGEKGCEKKGDVERREQIWNNPQSERQKKFYSLL